MPWRSTRRWDVLKGASKSCGHENLTTHLGAAVAQAPLLGAHNSASCVIPIPVMGAEASESDDTTLLGGRGHIAKGEGHERSSGWRRACRDRAQADQQEHRGRGVPPEAP